MQPHAAQPAPAQPSTAPAVSVLIAARRPPVDAFREAVRSVLRQTLRDLELVCVETDRDPEVAAVLREAADARVRHVLVPADTPLARARNVGLARCRSDLVAIIDADDIAEPTRLEVQRQWLSARPDVSVLGSWLTVIDPAGAVIGVRRQPTEDRAIREALRRRNPIAQPAVMFRRAVIVAAGSYLERPGGVCEDYELWCRLARAGARFANLPEPLTRYRLHAGSLKSTALRATLRDTIAIKRSHFGPDLTLRDRARIAAERCLCALPPSIVQRLFRLRHVRRPPGVPSADR